MILTITPNPSLDLLFTAQTLVWDDANRLAEPRRRPGGQGINVARAVRVLGGDATAITLLAGATGEEIRAVLAAEGTRIRAIDAARPTRLFVAVEERSSARSLLLNDAGPARDAGEEGRLFDESCRAMREAEAGWVACSGSLPAGFGMDFYARVCMHARRNGWRCVTDCDGVALAEAARAGVDLLVPNHHEASRLLDMPVTDIDSAAAAARRIRDRFRTSCTAITLGRLGAVLAVAEGTWTATAPVQAGHAVGAGDAFLAALLVGLDQGDPPPDLLRSAVGAGAAVPLSTGTDLLDAGSLAALRHAVTVSRFTHR